MEAQGNLENKQFISQNDQPRRSEKNLKPNVQMKIIRLCFPPGFTVFEQGSFFPKLRLSQGRLCDISLNLRLAPKVGFSP